MSQFRDEGEVLTFRERIVDKMIDGGRLELFGLEWRGDNFVRHNLKDAAEYAKYAYSSAASLTKTLLAQMSLDAAPIETSMEQYASRMEDEAALLEARARELRVMIANLRKVFKKK